MQRMILSRLILGCALSGGVVPLAVAADAPAVLVEEFIYERAPFPSCHASTIADTPSGLVAAWFGGTAEKAPDVGIWLSRHDGRSWSAPVEVATGVQSPETRNPCWNPVLFQMPDGPLLLFYKVGPDESRWWGELITSDDDGQSWSSPKRLPDGMLGPIKNKPVLYRGDLLCPSSTEHDGWKVHVERTPDSGQTWTKTEPLAGWPKYGAIQPAILVHAGGKLQMLCRSEQQRIVESWSDDAGRTWTPLAATELPNPDSGIDAVNLADGRILLVYNHTPRARSPLNVAISPDGKRWQAALELETQPGEYSYPAVICAADGTVHITYTWKRKKIKHVALDPAKLVLKEIESGRWPE